MPDNIYNPLDKKHLGESVAETLLKRPVVPLAAVTPFEGAGVYALYYRGPFPAYADVVRKGVPLYVGKAVPAGARRGRVGLDAPAGTVLYNRLQEHAESIRQALSTLDLAHFDCRYLVVDDIWIPLGESLLIRKFEPLWNQVLPGFGIHDPGGRRYAQHRSEWDTIHPGRPFAARCATNPRAPVLIAKWGAGTPPSTRTKR